MYSEFSREEYGRRVEAAKRAMRDHDLDGLVLTADWTGATNYRYLSGHLPRDFQMSYSRPHVFVMNRDGDASIVAIHFSAQLVQDMSWVQDVAVYTQPFDAQPVVDAIIRLGLRTGRIGWELGQDSRLAMPAHVYDEIKAALPGLAFVDASGMMWDLRKVKSSEEIDKIRLAAKLNGAALADGFTRRGDGPPSEMSIYKTIITSMIDNHPSPRPPFAQILSMSSTGFRTSAGPRSQYYAAQSAPLRPGDLVVVDSGCAVDGYWSEFARMGVYGPPSEEQQAIHSLLRRVVQAAAQEIVRPGISARQVITELMELYRDSGMPETQSHAFLNDPFRHLCHGVGLEASEPPLVRVDNNELLRVGMTLSVEAPYVIDEIRYVTEETVVIREHGTEVLSAMDEGLYEIPRPAVGS